MISSMTGFGKGEAANETCRVTVEINSVNRKQFEMRWTLPREFASMENELRALSSTYISRGAVNARLAVDFYSSSTNCTIDEELLAKLVESSININHKYDLLNSVDVASLLQVPGVVTVQPADSSSDELKACAIQATKAALESLRNMRNVEGEALNRDFIDRLNYLKELLTQIKPLVDEVPAKLKQKLLEKLQSENLNIDPNDERLLKEVLFYADKSDTTEEVVRLESHFGQFLEFLESSEPVGRSLDFLMQEMFREITTLSNKAAGPNVTPLTVAFKSELEKIREQVQNVE